MTFFKRIGMIYIDLSFSFLFFFFFFVVIGFDPLFYCMCSKWCPLFLILFLFVVFLTFKPYSLFFCIFLGWRITIWLDCIANILDEFGWAKWYSIYQVVVKKHFFCKYPMLWNFILSFFVPFIAHLMIL